MIILNHDSRESMRTDRNVPASLSCVRRWLKIGTWRRDDPRNRWLINIQKTSVIEARVTSGGDGLAKREIDDRPFDVAVWQDDAEPIGTSEAPHEMVALWGLTARIVIPGCPLVADGSRLVGTNHTNRESRSGNTKSRPRPSFESAWSVARTRMDTWDKSFVDAFVSVEYPNRVLAAPYVPHSSGRKGKGHLKGPGTIGS